MRKASTCQRCNAPLTLEMERDEALCVGCMRHIHDHHPTASARIAERLAKRLRVFKSLAIQAQERGDTHIEFHRDEIWTVEDEAALNAFENWALEHSVAQPLFPV